MWQHVTAKLLVWRQSGSKARYLSVISFLFLYILSLLLFYLIFILFSYFLFTKNNIFQPSPCRSTCQTRPRCSITLLRQMSIIFALFLANLIFEDLICEPYFVGVLKMIFWWIFLESEFTLWKAAILEFWQRFPNVSLLSYLRSRQNALLSSHSRRCANIQIVSRSSNVVCTLDSCQMGTSGP